MKLDFKGHERVRVLPASAQQIRNRSDSREENGYFTFDGEWDVVDEVLVVKFKPLILVNSALGAAASKKVKAHEQRHYDDFKRRANALRDALAAAIKEGRDPEMEDRWKWFIYDVRQDFVHFHRQEDLYVEIVMRPSGDRPK